MCEAALSSESRDFSEMKVPVSAFYVLATPLLCTIDRLLDTSVLFSQVSVAKVGFFFYNSFCDERLDNINSNLNISLNGAIIDQVLVFILTKILTLTFKWRFYLNRYQRKLVFSST